MQNEDTGRQGEGRTRQLERVIDQLRSELEEKQQQLDSKEALLRDVDYHMKSSLQLISSLLNLNAAFYAASDATGTVSRIASRLRVLIHIYGLFEERLIDQMPRIDLADYLHALSLDLLNSRDAARKRIVPRFELDPVRLRIDSAAALALIAHEALDNAVKHAFPGQDKGTVWLRLHDDGNERGRLVVADDGIGMAGDWRTRYGLGFTLIEGLAQQINAEIDMQSDDGTRLTVSFAV